MTDLIKLEKALYKVLEDLEPYLNSLILVGGWVPFLYRNFLWKEEIEKPIHTMDFDFGFSVPQGETLKETVYGQLSSLHYPEKHLSMDRMFPVVPHIAISDQEAPLPIEFLTDENTPKTLTDKFFGYEIKINRLEHFSMLIKNPMTVPVKTELKTLQVLVPTPERFLLHKILTYSLRKNSVKKHKDAYYAYYILRYHPNHEELLQKIGALNLGEEANQIKRILKKHFGSHSSAAILQTGKEMGYARSTKEMRLEIFEKFKMVEKVL